MGAETFRRWDAHVAKATNWPVNARGSADRAGPAQSNLHTAEVKGIQGTR